MTAPKKPAPSETTGAPSSPESEWPESPVRSQARRRLQELLVASSALGAISCSLTHGDPVPPPLRCEANGGPSALLEYIHGSADWVENESGRTLRVRVTVQAWGGGPLSVAGDPRLVGAALVRVEPFGPETRIYCTPAAGASQVDVIVPLSCSGIASCYHFRFDLSPSPAGSSLRLLASGPVSC